MPKIKKKPTNAQKRAQKEAKAERQKKYMWVFMNGKQVRVKHPQTIDGMDADEFILQNADSICLHQNEMWEELHARELQEHEEIIGVFICGSRHDSPRRGNRQSHCASFFHTFLDSRHIHDATRKQDTSPDSRHNFCNRS